MTSKDNVRLPKRVLQIPRVGSRIMDDRIGMAPIVRTNNGRDHGKIADAGWVQQISKRPAYENLSRHRIAGYPWKIVFISKPRRILIYLYGRRPGSSAVCRSDHIDIDIRTGIYAWCSNIRPNNIYVTAIQTIIYVYGHHRK